MIPSGCLNTQHCPFGHMDINILCGLLFSGDSLCSFEYEKSIDCNHDIHLSSPTLVLCYSLSNPSRVGLFHNNFCILARLKTCYFCLSRTQSSVLPFNQNFTSIVNLGWRALAGRSPDCQTILKLYLRSLRSKIAKNRVKIRTRPSLSLCLNFTFAYQTISTYRREGEAWPGSWGRRRLQCPGYVNRTQARVEACVNRFLCRDQRVCQ